MRNTLLENAFKFAHEGIVITDEHQNIVDINEAMQHITGYSRSDLIGSKPQILSAESQNKIFNQSLWQSLQRNGFWQGEVSNKRKDGTPTESIELFFLIWFLIEIHIRSSTKTGWKMNSVT